MLCLFRQSFFFLLSQLNGSGVQPSLSSDVKNRKNKEFTFKNLITDKIKLLRKCRILLLLSERNNINFTPSKMAKDYATLGKFISTVIQVWL